MKAGEQLTALARKRIAAEAVAILDRIGAYDCDYELVALDAAKGLGVDAINRDDMRDIAGRMGDLIALKIEEGAVS